MNHRLFLLKRPTARAPAPSASALREGPRQSAQVSSPSAQLPEFPSQRQTPGCAPPGTGVGRVAAVTEDAFCRLGEEGIIRAALWVFKWHLSWLPSGAGWRGLLGCCVLGCRGPGLPPLPAGLTGNPRASLSVQLRCLAAPLSLRTVQLGSGVLFGVVWSSQYRPGSNKLGKQETAARAGSVCTRIHKKENLQTLAIFVKMSMDYFQQRWLCSYRELSFPSSLPWSRASWGWLMPPP